MTIHASEETTITLPCGVYVLPAMPNTNGEWNEEFDSFAQSFAILLRQRSREDIQGGKDIDSFMDVMAFNRVIVAQDTGLAEAFRLFGFGTYKDDYILACYRAVRKIHPTGRTASILTEAHLDSYTRVADACKEWESRQDAMTRMLHPNVLETVGEILFEDFSPQRAEAIANVIGRGIIVEERIRDALGSFAGIPTPLIDGTL